MSFNPETSSCFIDSNVWIYALTQQPDERNQAKTVQAQAVIAAHSTIYVSTQVINEVCLNLLRKAGFSEVEVRAIADDFYRRYSVAFIGHDTMRRASLLREQHQFSFWDSLIFASALESASPILYSEDMHNGLQIYGVKIVNPFRIER
jgi:predicted nucleic acid-binding protein